MVRGLDSRLCADTNGIFLKTRPRSIFCLGAGYTCDFVCDFMCDLHANRRCDFMSVLQSQCRHEIASAIYSKSQLRFTANHT
jgi:hypothetical protein